MATTVEDMMARMDRMLGVMEAATAATTEATAVTKAATAAAANATAPTFATEAGKGGGKGGAEDERKSEFSRQLIKHLIEFNGEKEMYNNWALKLYMNVNATDKDLGIILKLIDKEFQDIEIGAATMVAIGKVP